MNKEYEEKIGTLAGLTFVLAPEEYTKYKKSLNEQLEEKDKKIERLNNIINETIEYIENEKNKQNSVGVYTKDIHKNLLKILKGDE
jgi:phosphate uptake regulator